MNLHVVLRAPRPQVPEFTKKIRFLQTFFLPIILDRDAT